MRKRISIRYENIKYFLLCIAPIMHMYKFVSIITVGEALLVLCIIITFLQNKNGDTHHLQNSTLFRNVLIMLFYYGIISLIGCSIYNTSFIDVLKEYLVWVLYFVIGFILIENINLKKFLFIYKKIALFTAVFVIAQYICYQLFHIHIPGMIPNMVTSYGTITNHYNDVYFTGARANGFFTEPSFVATYLAIPSIISVFELKKDGKMISLFFVIINLALLLTLSGTAIIILIINIIYYAKYVFKFRKDNLIYCIIILVISIATLNYILSLEVFQKLFSRINEISGNGQFNSGYIRITRGFVAFFHLPFFSKLFGIGFGNYATIVTNNLIQYLTTVTSTLVTWLNDIQTYLIDGGIIGIILYVNYLITDIKKKNKLQLAVLSQFIILQFIDNIFNAPLWLFYFFIIFSTNNWSNIYGGE